MSDHTLWDLCHLAAKDTLEKCNECDVLIKKADSYKKTKTGILHPGVRRQYVVPYHEIINRINILSDQCVDVFWDEVNDVRAMYELPDANMYELKSRIEKVKTYEDMKGKCLDVLLIAAMLEEDMSQLSDVRGLGGKRADYR